jgi:hypothetical protein
MPIDYTKPQLRMTAAEFASQNPTPELGQLCIPWDRGWYKIGDGSTAFNDLTRQKPLSLTSEERAHALVLYQAQISSDARDEAGEAASGPLYYVARMAQSGVNPIVLTEVTNTASVTPDAPGYSSPGDHSIAFPGVFINDGDTIELIGTTNSGEDGVVISLLLDADGTGSYAAIKVTVDGVKDDGYWPEKGVWIKVTKYTA